MMWRDDHRGGVAVGSRLRRGLVFAVLALSVIATGCQTSTKPQAGPVASTSSSTTSTPADSTSTSTSIGSASSTRVPRSKKPYDSVLRATLKSVAGYWGRTMPRVYGRAFRPIKGGIYAYSQDSTIPPCGGVGMPYLLVQQNAFYCPESDFIAWDDQGLFPRLEKRYGPFLLAIVLAHEWGHSIQHRQDLTYLDGVTLEQQADCFAGSWAASLNPSTDPVLAKLRDKDLDRSLSGFVEFRDSLGMTGDDLGAHGTAFDRIRAFQEGFDGGAKVCADYEDELPTLVAVPYRSFKERFRGGNLPFDQVVSTLRPRIDKFWREELGAGPTPEMKPADGLAFCSSPPRSPEGFNDEQLAWCSDTNTLLYSEATLRTLYDTIGDMGAGTELALAQAIVHETVTGADPTSKPVWLRAICTVGAWTGSMYQPDDPESSLLSPGDVDEGVRTLLEYAAKGSAKDFGTGFEQVAAYRKGVLGSVQDCGSPVSS